MTFELVKEDGNLWAVHYDNEQFNTLAMVFEQWNDMGFLQKFFTENFEDLQSYFKITNVNQAIFDTIDDSEELECLIMDISPDANLDELFRPLENSRASEMMLGKEKTRLRNRPRHASWLRLYAIKLSAGMYIITGGSIKLTRTMQERAHTLAELQKMEKVRQYLIDNNVLDDDSFIDFIKED